MVKRKRNYIIKEYNITNVLNYFNLNNSDINNRLIKAVNKLNMVDCFIHITYNLEKILNSRILLCSPGGLGGVLYVVPSFNGTIHNLGDYIINSELPMFMKNNDINKSINNIKINVDIKKIGIVNYLEFGKYYLSIFNQKFFNKILPDVLEKKYDEEKEKAKISVRKIDNLNYVQDIINSSNVLRMICFESLLDYLFLFQKEVSDEFNNAIVKNLLFDANPLLKKKFSLSNFNFNYDYIKQILDDNKFYVDKFDEFMKIRLKHNINKYIIEDNDNLKGHIIFRYFDLRKDLEKELALLLWSEAKEFNYNIITYYTPKGEFGLLPGNYMAYVNKDKFNIEIKNAFSEHTVMRNPYKEE